MDNFKRGQVTTSVVFLVLGVVRDFIGNIHIGIRRYEWTVILGMKHVFRWNTGHNGYVRTYKIRDF